MENAQSQSPPNTIPGNNQPTDAKMPPAERVQANRFNTIKISLAIGAVLLFCASAYFFYQNRILSALLYTPKTYEECVKQNGNQQMAIYPGVCVTKDGRRFTQPLSEEEKKNLLPPDPSQDWELYTSPTKTYSFKHPPGLKSDTGAAGDGFESIRFLFMGQKQIASGRTQTELADGYSFIVTKLGPISKYNAQTEARIAHENSKEFCVSDGAVVTPVTKTKVDGMDAYQYTANCMGDNTLTFTSDSKSVYSITQFTAGDAEDVPDYKNITSQILSTFRFLPPADTVIGINTNTCCGCPTIIPANQIGKDGWVMYTNGKNYSSMLPEVCKMADCQPQCPSIAVPDSTEQISEITANELSRGWYWGTSSQKKTGTPETWVYLEGGRSSCWHKPGIPCTTPAGSKYICPENGIEGCMPQLTGDAVIQCSPEALQWKTENCPGFQGAAL